MALASGAELPCCAGRKAFWQLTRRVEATFGHLCPSLVTEASQESASRVAVGSLLVVMRLLEPQHVRT